MKVGNENQIQSAHQNAQLKELSKNNEARSNSEAIESPSSPGLNAAEVSLSSRSKEMASIKEIAENAPDVRELKISELKARIANGEYNVKPDDIADRMLREHAQEV